MNHVARIILGPKRYKIYSKGGIQNWDLSLIYSPRSVWKRFLFRSSLAFDGITKKTFSLPSEISEYLEKLFVSTNLHYVAMTSHKPNRWIIAIKSKESNLKVLVKFGSLEDSGLLREEEFHRKFKNMDLSVPLLESFTTSLHRVLVFPFYPTSHSMRANQMELSRIASSLQALQLKHNDLTPWNTIRKNKKHLLIDWEDFQESSQLSDLKGVDSETTFRNFIWVSLIASSLGNFLLNLFIARGDVSSSDLGKFSALFSVYVLLLGTSRAIFSEVGLTATLRKENIVSTQKVNQITALTLIITLAAIITSLFSSSENLNLVLALILLSNPLFLDYIRFEFLRILNSRAVTHVDILWTVIFVFLVSLSYFLGVSLDSIEYFIIWEISAFFALSIVLIVNKPRFETLPNATKLPSSKTAKKLEIRTLSLIDYFAIYGLPLLISIALFNVINGHMAFAFRLATMLLAILPIVSQVALFETRNLWIKNALNSVSSKVLNTKRITWDQVSFIVIGGLICFSSVIIPYEKIFLALAKVEKVEFQLTLFFLFISYLSLYLTTQIRNWLRYFGDFRIYVVGIISYLVATVCVSVVSLLNRDILLWTLLSAFTNLFFILIWNILYQTSFSRYKEYT